MAPAEQKNSAQNAQNVQTVLRHTPAADICLITSEEPAKIRLMLSAKKPLTVLHILKGRAAYFSGKHYRILAEGETFVTPAVTGTFCTQTGGLECIMLSLKPSAYPGLSFPSEKCVGVSPELKAAFSAALQHADPEALTAPLARFSWVEDTGISCSRSQMTLALSAYEYLYAHSDRHISIDQLASRLKVSPTHLKNGFRLVFGESVYAYLRVQKMLAAAELLQKSDRTVLDIAGEFGYDNGSKFAKAFQAVTGKSPREYRGTPNAAPESLSHIRRHPPLSASDIKDTKDTKDE